jgi:hypothetical protein
MGNGRNVFEEKKYSKFPGFNRKVLVGSQEYRTGSQEYRTILIKSYSNLAIKTNLP